MEKLSSQRGPRGIGLLPCLVVALLLLTLALWLSSSFVAPWNCDTPEGCFQEMLQGSPAWNDPQLLKVVREEFLRAPSEVIPSSETLGLSQEDREILKAVREKIGELGFVVTASDVSPGLVWSLGRGPGLWIDPQPENRPRRSPLPHLWYSHACLTASVPYLNDKGHQCLSLASLLHALGRPSVDLVLGQNIHPARILNSLCDEYDRPVKAALLSKREPLDLLLEEFSHRVASVSDIGNNSLILFRNY